LDMSTTAWKTYNSVTWVAANATLIGMSLQDTTACVAARTFDSYKACSEINSIQLEIISNTVVQATQQFAEINVFGNLNKFGNSKPSWDITQHLDSGLTESPTRTYYLYTKESGQPVVSDVAPIQRRDLHGLYYPTNVWRCVGSVYNDSSTNFTTPVKSFRPSPQAIIQMGHFGAYVNGTVSTDTFPHTAAYSDYFIHKYSNPNSEFTVAVAASNAWGDLASITVPIGLWKITGEYNIGDASAPPVATTMQCGIGITTGDFAPVLEPVRVNLMKETPSQAYVRASTYFVQNDTGAVVYYLKGKIGTASSTTRLLSYSLFAERIDKLTGIPQ